MTVRLEPGDRAPAFTLKDQHSSDVKLSDFRGQNVILYFYPQAMTPACTNQACDFRDSFAPLQAAGYTVIGISPDEVSRLETFAERDELPFTLLSDPTHKVLKKYGTWGEKKNYGRTHEGLIRSTFVINKKGIIEHALYNVKATGHVARIRKLVGLDS